MAGAAAGPAKAEEVGAEEVALCVCCWVGEAGPAQRWEAGGGEASGEEGLQGAGVEGEGVADGVGNGEEAGLVLAVGKQIGS